MKQENSRYQCAALFGLGVLSGLLCAVWKPFWGRRKQKLTRQLEQTRALLISLFENAPIGLGVWDRHFRFLGVNQALAAITGIPVDEHIGKTFTEVLPDLYQQVHPLFCQVLETAKPLLNQEIQGRTQADPHRTRIWSASYFPILFEGEIEAVGIACEDITEKKAAEANLRQAAKLESIRMLAGGVAHDFNNLLTGIMGNASLLDAEFSENSPAAAMIHSILMAGERAADLTRQLLAYAGRGQFVIQHCNLSSLIGETRGLLDACVSANVELHLDLHPHLPDVEADREQMQQIVLNLVTNGVEAIGEQNRGIIYVTTSVQVLDEKMVGNHASGQMEGERITPGCYCCIEIHDTGAGMDAEMQTKIFDPFFTTKFAGRGLGLSAVMGIVQAHHGVLRVYSTPGQGSTFRVLLPALAGRQPMLPSVVPESATPVTNGTVLVVDDELVVRDMAKMILQQGGWTVITAENGWETVELLRKGVPDVSAVLLDITMPVMSGEEAFRQIQEIAPDMPVLLSSGYSEREVNRRFQGQRLAGFLQKPYTARQLTEKLQNLLVEQTPSA